MFRVVIILHGRKGTHDIRVLNTRHRHRHGFPTNVGRKVETEYRRDIALGGILDTVLYFTNQTRHERFALIEEPSRLTLASFLHRIGGFALLEHPAMTSLIQTTRNASKGCRGTDLESGKIPWGEVQPERAKPLSSALEDLGVSSGQQLANHDRLR